MLFHPSSPVAPKQITKVATQQVTLTHCHSAFKLGSQSVSRVIMAEKRGKKEDR